ncbi:ribosomal protection-like ABC-F family protein [Ethanoligenens sp.]|uniref:ribosomal protection-like ABC-F family protein n=1 Tax=Ethanoligenens sp. TaxID=2099655 RepID=UPI0039E7ABD6
MSLISISNLTFSYENSFDNVFENVSFQIDTDWKLGFTGRNGRGKTTFLNLLLGKYEYKGTISTNVDFEYFPFLVPDKSQNTAHVIESIDSGYPYWKLARELSMMGISEEVLYRPFCTLSNGEQTKVLLAALFLKKNSFLLIDEPTNHLDMAARELVSSYLNKKKGFILVSHDRVFLDGCIDHILSINKDTIDIQKGNFSSWWENKQRQDNFELAENTKLKKDIKHLHTATKRTAEWADKVERTKIGFVPGKTEKNIARRSAIGEKSRKMMQRSKSIQHRQQAAIAEKAELLHNIESAESLKISPLSYHADRLVTLEHVSVLYGGKKVVADVSFTIEQGDRIAICGKNGSGKSSILKLIHGKMIEFSGHFKRGNNLDISYVPQDTSFLEGSLSAFAAENGLDESLFKAILRKLDFSRIQFQKDMHDFSGGQKEKVLIAKSLCEKSHLYIWDEPLNYIDIFSRIQIEQLLKSCRSTILFVEHDRSFIENIATKIITL